MSSGCGDVLTLEDLKIAKLHQVFEAEVITGKLGGLPSGADIDYATNAVTGQTQKTLPAVLRDSGYQTASFDFASGGTIAVGERNKAVLWPLSAGGDGDYYYWEGILPKVIPAASSPSSTGGVAVGAWRPVGDLTLRSQLANTTNTVLGDQLVGVKAPLTLSSSRTQHEKNSDTISILDFAGVDATGATDSTPALVAAMAAGRTVHIPSGANITVAPATVLAGHLIVDGVLTVNSTSTFACSVTVRAGSINVNSGFNVTFTASFAGPSARRIFNGAGNVYGIRHVYPEWWGAEANKTTDCAAALNAASECVKNSSGLPGLTRPCIELMSGEYLISSTWQLPASADVGIEIKGQGIVFAGTRIVAAATFSGSDAVLLPGLTDTTQRIMDYKIGNFGIVPETPGMGPAYGFTIGSAGKSSIGLKESLVYDMYIANFSNSMHVINARMVKMERLGIWNDGMTTASNCLFIESEQKFCGDMTLHNCQFVNRQSVAGSRCVLIDSAGTFVGDGDQAFHIAGIRFTECIIYPAATSVAISANNGARVDDVFMTNCQWDGDSNTMLSVSASGAGSQINDIQIVHNYMYGGNKTPDSQIQFQTSNGAEIKNVRIDSNTIGAGVGRVVNFTPSATDSISGVSVSGNHIVDFNNPINPAIEFGAGCSRFQCNNNTPFRTAGVFFPYLVQIDAGCNNYIVTGNMGAGIVSSTTIREVSPGASRVVANNL